MNVTRRVRRPRRYDLRSIGCFGNSGNGLGNGSAPNPIRNQVGSRYFTNRSIIYKVCEFSMLQRYPADIHTMHSSETFSTMQRYPLDWLFPDSGNGLGNAIRTQPYSNPGRNPTFTNRSIIYKVCEFSTLQRYPFPGFAPGADIRLDDTRPAGYGFEQLIGIGFQLRDQFVEPSFREAKTLYTVRPAVFGDLRVWRRRT